MNAIRCWPKRPGSDFKGELTLAIYATAVPLAFVSRWLAFGLYVVVAIIWLVPERRIEQEVTDS